jgi:Holliday junction DNA helicase RuvA
VIASVSGVLTEKAPESIVIQTDGGVGYALTVPLGVFERLPAPGERVSLYTELVVREDGWALFGFDQPSERAVFQRLLGASGFGPRLALALLSALGPERTVRSIQQRDIAALSTVNGIGRKKAERLVLELADRFQDLAVASPRAAPGAGEEAVSALVGLGYAPARAEEAVREVLADGGGDTARIVRQALQLLAGRK